MSDRSLSPPEQKVSDPFLGSQETEMKQMEITPETIVCCGCCPCCAGCAGWLSRFESRLSRLKAWASHHRGVLISIGICIIIGIGIGIYFAMQPKPCPEGWIGYLGKCYYFSEAEADWTSSQSHCSALGVSLAGIDTQQEMDFMKSYDDSAGYWIGLRRDPGQPWKWTSGTEFNNWFPIAGEETCAFMNGNDISSSSCSNKQRWICSK